VRKTLIALVSLALLLSLAAAPVSAVKPIRDASPRHDSPNYNNGVALALKKGEERTAQPPLGPAKVGQVRTWLGLDDAQGSIYLKNYTLRGTGNHVEVWVANNLNFPAGDCRNDGVRNVITNTQVTYLIDQFDNNMYPIESDWWSVPPARNGHSAVLPKLIPNIPSSEYKGEGDNVVVLVDNVRDSNYYDTNNVNTLSYIAGFYYSVFDDYFDRTVMSVDAWDWIHRTGADPAHAPTTSPCTSAPARPYLYEGVFAHEYQHLLHRYTDPDEVNWVNEGLSDFTEVITGYADLSKHVNEKGYESHTNCYLGWDSVFHVDWNPIPRACGPENSLTAWGDQGDGEILADYGFAMYFMNFVNSQGFGKDFFRSWQHNAGNGIDGLNAALAAAGSSSTFESLFDDQIISALADGYIDNGASVTGATAGQLQNSATEATIYPSTQMNGTAGAPPWGADYIDLGPSGGIASVAFNGDDQFVFPGGPDWVLDGDGFFTNPDVTGGVYDNNQDLSIAIDASAHVGEVLSFDHYYQTEPAWDFGFVQVSADGGDSWQSLACSGTTSAHDPGAISSIVANMPGYTDAAGTAGAPVHVTCPALPAGTDYLAFRLMSDPSVQFDGWHVKNIQLNGATPAGWGTLANWTNERFFSPVDLTFGFALVGITGTVDGFGDVTAGTSVKVVRPTLGAGNAYSLTPADFTALSGSNHVWALVWGIPSSEDSSLYQPYSLMVNGAERHDGL
jgi:hypothetical protein